MTGYSGAVGLDELAELVAALETVDDESGALVVADRVLDEAPWIGDYADADDSARMKDAAVAGIDRGRIPLTPSESGVSAATLARAERRAHLLQRLADRLGSYRSARAAELKLEAEISSIGSLNTLGRTAEAEAVLDAVIDGPLAIGLAACDSIIARITQRGTFNYQLLTVRQLKAGLLYENDENEAALAVLQALVDEFADNRNPVIVALVGCALDSMGEIRNDAG